MERKLEQQSITTGRGSRAVSPSSPGKTLGWRSEWEESASTFSYTVLGLSTPNKIQLLVPTQNKQEVMHTGSERPETGKDRAAMC